ncbi:MAG: hypothetical protein NZ956_01815 [Candidatus Caldarchaeum sp.]|nr:hypothetical protein [Candidatus Caldarchaeum sp.]
MGGWLAEAYGVLALPHPVEGGEGMKIFFASTDETGISAALKLANAGFKTFFYSPNPYVESKAANHDQLTHRCVNKIEFIKLCAEDRFKVISEPLDEADETWLHVNTVKDGKDEYASAENIVKLVTEKITATKTLVLSGLTKVGEAEKLLSSFTKRCMANPEEQRYVGGLSLFDACIPVWRKGTQASTGLTKLSHIPFDELAEAESATIAQVFARAAFVEALVEMTIHSGHYSILTNCVHDPVLLHPESIDVLKYFKSHNLPPLVANMFGKIAKTAFKTEKQAVSRISELAKKARKQLRILVVSHSEAAFKKISSNFKSKNVRLHFVSDQSITGENIDSYTGFDGVLVNSLRIDLLKEFHRRYEHVWFVLGV